MKIAYYPAGDRNFASSRLRVWKIADELVKRGHEVAFVPDDPTAYDVCVVQKRTDCEGVMRDCRESGVRVVLDCDDYMRLDTTYADVVTVDTPSKLELYPSAVVVPDALDVEPDSPRKTVHQHALKRAVWVGNQDNLYHIHHAAEACRKLDIELTVITNLNGLNVGETYGVRGVQWVLKSVDAELVEHDLFIAPFVVNGAWSPEWVRSKSANRILKAWRLGLPVAATRIPSYAEAGLRYAATTTQEWIDVLTALMPLSARVVDAARGCLRTQQYTAGIVAQKWLEVFTG